MSLLHPLAQANCARPTTSYTEALSRFQALVATEGDEFHPRCHTQLRHHGCQTQWAIVFIHGYTNCPYQFHQLAAQFHLRGWNTLSLRLPGHGYGDRLTTALRNLRPKELADMTTEGLDIGRGLGQQLAVLGFSLGGVLAAWAGQQRADLDHAILVSPAIGIRALPSVRRQLAAHFLTVWPNFYQWWNPNLKENQVEPLHAYPRFSSRSLAALLRFGLLVQRDAARTRPQARTITVITNPQDLVVDNEVTARVVADWRAHGADVKTYAFPHEWELLHDIIDPTQPKQQVARVYPQLLQWINDALPASGL